MLMQNRPIPVKDIEIIIDTTHLGKRHVTGIERVTLELFSENALSSFHVRMVGAKNKLHMLWQQNISLPFMALQNRKLLVLTPGFPPAFLLSIFGKRVIPYIHDLFLITRWGDLSLLGKLYMSAPFRLAVKMLPRFFVNSEATRDELIKFCRKDAQIILYRPPVRNVFALSVPKLKIQKSQAANVNTFLKLIALGTVEPRKNLKAAADILSVLRAGEFPDATLDIVGRIGWGGADDYLKTVPGVTLHGYRSAVEIKNLLESADLLISTSHDEGLGLPLLEAQYSGLAVIAPDQPVFREVLGTSGIFIDTNNPHNAAQTIKSLVISTDWRLKQANLAEHNLQRWNTLAASDHVQVIALLGGLLSVI